MLQCFIFRDSCIPLLPNLSKTRCSIKCNISVESAKAAVKLEKYPNSQNCLCRYVRPQRSVLAVYRSVEGTSMIPINARLVKIIVEKSMSRLID